MSTKFLASYSKKDKKWDKHKRSTVVVASHYRVTEFKRLATAMQSCAQVLWFKWQTAEVSGEARLRLFKAFLCHSRHCPICQWRRAQLLQHRLLTVLPKFEITQPKMRWIFLTVTVRNCPLTSLRQQLKAMNVGWRRLSDLKDFPGLGFIRSTEVTRGKDGSAHPHFHVLIPVNPSYFSHGYITQAQWTTWWRNAMRLDYQPVVDVRRVRSKNKQDPQDKCSVVTELVKYTVKVNDLMHDPQWLAELTKQLKNLRFFATGGLLKKVISTAEPTTQELLTLDEFLLQSELGEIVRFMWRTDLKRYCKSTVLEQS